MRLLNKRLIQSKFGYINWYNYTLYFPLSGTTSPNPFDLGDMGSTMPLTINNTGAKPKKSVNSLLGEHSNLVNLDNLVTDSKNQGEKFN
jgi:hypothetical protein